MRASLPRVASDHGLARAAPSETDVESAHTPVHACVTLVAPSLHVHEASDGSDWA